MVMWEPGWCLTPRGWAAWLLLLREGVQSPEEDGERRQVEAEGHSSDFAHRSSCSAGETGAGAAPRGWVGFLHEPAAPMGCRDTLKMQRDPGNLCGGFQPGMHEHCPPKPHR